jgi:hypothetical protein
MTDVSDTQLERAVKAVEDASVVVLRGKRVLREDGGIDRGPTALVVRGRSLVKLPGEAGFRELERFELEAVLELARAGEVKLAVPFIPALGRDGRWGRAAFQLEDGSVLTPESDRYPLQAIRAW